jgi:hypothetical protein
MLRCKLRSSEYNGLTYALAVWLGSAQMFACGPFFPNTLLNGGDAAVLVAPKASFQREIERMKLIPARYSAKLATNGYSQEAFDADLADLRVALKRTKLPEREQSALFKQHETERQKLPRRLESPLELAVAVPEGLPGEFADYFRGSIAWHSGDYDAARTAWQALLNRPASERHFKSTWAAFMLGKMELGSANKDPDKAIALFSQVRDHARQGFADSLGLAASSLGWEAQVHFHENRFARAIELYLEQAAGGDPSAVLSLREVAAKVLRQDAATLQNLAAHGLSQRVVTAYLISQRRWVRQAAEEETGTEHHDRWLAAVEAAGVRDVDSAEKLALAAYQAGEMEKAERWVQRSRPDALAAQWIQAKLFLYRGKISEAAALLAKVAHDFPVQSDQRPVKFMGRKNLQDLDANRGHEPTPSPLPGGEPGTVAANEASLLGGAGGGFMESLSIEFEGHPSIQGRQQLLGELGALRLTRREFTEALDALLRSGFWMDAAYVAERVLTPDELKTYVDRNWPAVVHDPGAAEAEAADSGESSPDFIRANLRHLLARRLARLDRRPEARPYYPASLQERFDALSVALLTGGNEKLARAQRAAALFEAAKITRYEGMELMATSVESDWAVHHGSFEYGVTAASRASDQENYLVASADERDRALKHATYPKVRFHYRYVAAFLAWDAAGLMPGNSDETAKVLCQAGSWLKDRDPKTADLFYKTLVRRCRKTAIGAEADRLRWFPKLDQDGNLAPIVKPLPKPIETMPIMELL